METIHHNQKDRSTQKNRALPEVPMAAASELSTPQRLLWKPSSDSTAAELLRDTPLDVTVEAPERDHPMASFDKLLEAFEAYIEGRGPGFTADNTPPSTRQQQKWMTFSHQQQQGQLKKKRQVIGDDRRARSIRSPSPSSVVSAASVAPTDARGGGNTRLPQLRPNNRIAHPVPAKQSEKQVFRSRSLEEALTVDSSSRTRDSPSPAHSHSESPLKVSSYDLDDGPFDVMLRSKHTTEWMTSKQRRNIDNVEIADDPEYSNGFVVVGSKNSGGDHSDTALEEIVTPNCSSSFGAASPPAGIFRISDPDTGFVHYGYSWDLSGAKAEQLLKLEQDTVEIASDRGHPHKGLSSVAQWHKRHDGESQTRRHVMGRPVDWLCFEVSLSRSFYANQTDDLLLTNLTVNIHVLLIHTILSSFYYYFF